MLRSTIVSQIQRSNVTDSDLCSPNFLRHSNFFMRQDPGTSRSEAESNVKLARPDWCFPQFRDSWESVYEFRYDWNTENMTDLAYNGSHSHNKVYTCYGTSSDIVEMKWEMARENSQRTSAP